MFCVITGQADSITLRLQLRLRTFDPSDIWSSGAEKMSHTVSAQEIFGSGGKLSVDFLDIADGGLPTAER